MDTHPLNWDGAVLIVGFQPEHPFRLAQAEQKKHRGLVEEMVSEFMGQTIRVQYEMMQGPLTAPADPPVADPETTPLTVDQIIDLFPGSRVVYSN